MKRTIVSAFVAIAGGNILTTVIMIVTIPILVRLLGAEGYGVYATLMAVFGLLMILVSSGIDAGVRKYLAEERDDPYWKDNVFAYYFRLAAVLSILAALVLIVATEVGLVEQGLGDRFTTHFYLLGILTISAQFRNYLRRAIMGLKLEHISEPIEVGHKILFAIIAIGLLYFGFGVAGVLLGHIIASVLAAGTSLIVLHRHLSLSRTLKPTPREFPRDQLLSFNHFAILYVFLLSSLFHVDVLMLEYFTTSRQVGYYKAALVTVEFLWFVPRSVQSVMIQSTSNLWIQGEIDRINRLSSKVSRYTILITVLMATGLAVLTPSFVSIYFGPDFTPAITPILLLLPGTLGFALARPIMSISIAKGDIKILIAATGASALLNFGLNLSLIPLYGLEGAAIATSIGYGSMPFFHTLAAFKLGYHPLQDIRIGRIASTTVLAGLVIIGISLLISSPHAALVIIPPVGFVVFFALAIGTGALTLTEIRYLLSRLPPPLERHAMIIHRKIEDL